MREGEGCGGSEGRGEEREIEGRGDEREDGEEEEEAREAIKEEVDGSRINWVGVVDDTGVERNWGGVMILRVGEVDEGGSGEVCTDIVLGLWGWKNFCWVDINLLLFVVVRTKVVDGSTRGFCWSGDMLLSQLDSSPKSRYRLGCFLGSPSQVALKVSCPSGK